MIHHFVHMSALQTQGFLWATSSPTVGAMKREKVKTSFPSEIITLILHHWFDLSSKKSILKLAKSIKTKSTYWHRKNNSIKTTSHLQSTTLQKSSIQIPDSLNLFIRAIWLSIKLHFILASTKKPCVSCEKIYYKTSIWKQSKRPNFHSIWGNIQGLSAVCAVKCLQPVRFETPVSLKGM